MPVRRVAAGAAALIVLAGLLFAALVGYIAWSARSGVAQLDGAEHGLAVQAPVRILRDARGIAHIRAANRHDLFFGQGYATGSDRLFQIDLTRRFVLGRLAEVLGANVLPVDERQRTLDVRAIVERQYAALSADARMTLAAFADGVNAAAEREPAPPEFRTLAFTFERWRPQDALVVGFATTLALADSPQAVIVRDRVVREAGPRAADAFFSLTDPAYDTPTVGGAHVPVAPLPPLDGPHPFARATAALAREAAELGSNEWAAGGARTAGGRALLANDPHLDSSIPGIWHIVDLAAPGFHVAGATLAGVPGVVLGHNDRIAWGSTNGTVAGPRVYAETFTAGDALTYREGDAVRAATARIEHFAVRFAPAAERRYTSTRHGYVLEERGIVRHAVQWYNAQTTVSSLRAFAALDAAPSLEAARIALAAYPGPVQNFVVADDRGRAFYTLAGFIPAGIGAGLAVADGARSAVTALRGVPRGQLPQLPPSRDLVVNNSNNLPYGAGYRERLSPAFSPPYRAAEIAADLRRRRRYTAEDFRAIAADPTSFAERDLARWCVAAERGHTGDLTAGGRAVLAALAAFDGRITAESHGATAVQYLATIARRDLVRSLLPTDVADAYLATGPAFVTLMRALRERPRGWFSNDDRDAFLRTEFRAMLAEVGTANVDLPYGEAFASVTLHPLAAFGIPWWNAPRIPGSGGRYAPAVHTADFGQSFRAVWDVGNWDAGGIDIPLGESGEPGSPHYTDLAARYVAHALTPLPYSDAAVARATRRIRTLLPGPG